MSVRFSRHFAIGWLISVREGYNCKCLINASRYARHAANSRTLISHDTCVMLTLHEIAGSIPAIGAPMIAHVCIWQIMMFLMEISARPSSEKDGVDFA